jgi:cell division protein FtsB
MILTVETILAFILGAVVVSVIFLIRNYYAHKYLRKQISKLQKENEETFFEGLRKGRNERLDQDDDYKIQIRPYVKKTSKSGFFSESYKADIGYQYQLLVKGIPCFEPHVVIQESIEQEKIDHQKIQLAINSVMGTIQALEKGSIGRALSVIKEPLLNESKG